MNEKNGEIKSETLIPEKFSISINFPSSNKSSKANIEKEIKNDKIFLDLHTIGYKYQTMLQLLWKYIHEIGAAAEVTAVTNFATLAAILTDISERKKKAKANEYPLAHVTIEFTGKEESTKNNKTVTMSEPIFEETHIQKIIEYHECNEAALRILNETAIQQIVNNWESLISELLEWRLLADPESIPKDRNISYKEILLFKDIDEVKHSVINQEIEAFLKSKSAEEQIKHFNKEFGIDLASHFPSLNELMELILRRHTIVHAGGIASSEYIRRVKNIKGIDFADITEGKPFPINAKYVKHAWSLTYAAGIVLLHMVVQKHARDIKSEELEDKADKLLINGSFEAIKYSQYESAEMILRYAYKLHLSSESSKLIILINLAQTMKWIKREEECEKILKEYDWESSNSLFRLCVSSLMSDFELFKNLLPIVVSEKLIKVSDIYEWPVFREIRKNKDFETLITQVFGIEKPSILLNLAPKVINLRPDTTLNALKIYMEDVLQIEESVMNLPISLNSNEEAVNIKKSFESEPNIKLPIVEELKEKINPPKITRQSPNTYTKKHRHKHKRK